MKASLIKFWILFTLSLIASSTFAMDVQDENQSENNQSDQLELSIHDRGITRLLKSQLRGVHSLFQFGIGATRALLSLSEPNTESILPPTIPQNTPDILAELIHTFLHEPAKYGDLVRFIPKDVRFLLARRALHDHPLISIISARLAANNASKRHTFGQARRARFNKNGDKIVTVFETNGGRASIWDVNSGKCLLTLDDRQICSASFSELGDRLVTTSWDCTTKIWCSLSGNCLLTLGIPKTGFNLNQSASFNLSGNKVLTRHGDGTFAVYDLISFQRLFAGEGGPSWFNFYESDSLKDRILVKTTANIAGDLKSMLLILDSSSGKIVQSLDMPDSDCWTEDIFGPMCWIHHLGKNVMVMGRSGKAIIWDAFSGQIVKTLILNVSSDHFNDVCFSFSGHRLLTAAKDVKFWNAHSGKIISTLNVCPHAIALSPNGKQAVTIECAHDPHLAFAHNKPSSIKIWDTDSGRCIKTCRGGPHDCNAQFSKDGRNILIYSEDEAWLTDSCPNNVITWLKQECSFEQAVLLLYLYETVIINMLLKKRNVNYTRIKFDFNKHPHLQEHFNSLPEPMRNLFESYILKPTTWLQALIPAL